MPDPSVPDPSVPDPSDPSPTLLVLSTFANADQAAAVARSLVGERLAACVNLVPRVRSIYRWQDEVHDEAEVLAVIKTAATRYDALVARLVALHPYDVPELIALPIVAGHAPYLAWLADQVTP